MKSLIQLLFAILIIFSCTKNRNSDKTSFDSDKKAVEVAILNSYIEGLQNEGDTIKIDQSFHPQFALIGKGEKCSIWALPIQEWRVRQSQKALDGELPLKDPNRVSAQFVFVDVTKDVAVAKLFYYQSGKHVYTDYISLYKFDSEWKIVSKVFTKI